MPWYVGHVGRDEEFDGKQDVLIWLVHVKWVPHSQVVIGDRSVLPSMVLKQKLLAKVEVFEGIWAQLSASISEPLN